MAKSINKVLLLGNLTKDPELKYTPNGTAVTSFSIATNKTYKDASGEWKEIAEFHRLVAWGKLAEIISQYCNKGSKVHVEGRLQTREYTAKDNTKRYVTEVVASELVMLGGRSEQTQATQPAQPVQNRATSPANEPLVNSAGEVAPFDQDVDINDIPDDLGNY